MNGKEAKNIHMLEQGMAAGKDMARMVSGYYHQLIADGVPDYSATTLASAFQGFFLEQGQRRAESDDDAEGEA